MKNEIKIIDIQKKENKIIYDYDVDGDVGNYLIR